MTPDPARHEHPSAAAWGRGRLRLVPGRRRSRLAVEGVVSPELVAILHFTLLTLMRSSAAPVGVADDLRLAVDELLGAERRNGATVAAEVAVEGRTVSLSVTVPWDVPEHLDDLVAPLVDDLEDRRSALGTVITMQRSW